MKTFLEKTFTKNKKGSHVDWAISMGLFLVYIIGMFILLRPGITPVYKPEGLLGILEDKFDEEVMWEVREIPLFVENCKFEGGLQPLDCKIDIRDNNDPTQFTFSKIFCEEGGCLGKEHVTGDSIVCDNSNEKPNIIKSRFKLIYHLKDGIGIDKEAKPKLIVEHSNSNEEYCKGYLGASVSKFGINWDWLGDLKTKTNDEYLELAYEDWNFPEDMNFVIFAGSSESGLDQYVGPMDNAGEFLDIPQGVNIFIKQFKTQRVNRKGGITIPIIVNMRVW